MLSRRWAGAVGDRGRQVDEVGRSSLSVMSTVCLADLRMPKKIVAADKVASTDHRHQSGPAPHPVPETSRARLFPDLPVRKQCPHCNDAMYLTECSEREI
jgi:hypothetical protein